MSANARKSPIGNSLPASDFFQTAGNFGRRIKQAHGFREKYKPRQFIDAEDVRILQRGKGIVPTLAELI